MIYEKIVPGKFQSRPNRFIAMVEMGGELHTCHVKNTGWCRELLVPGARVYLSESGNPQRKTKYDLVAVEKGGLLINMDSQAPNRVAGEWLRAGGLFPDLLELKPEYPFGSSRIDFWGRTGAGEFLLEVKGVTLEEKGTAMFPDAPTIRGVKHLDELRGAVGLGFSAYVLFVIQMRGPARFIPNRRTDPAFAEALGKARAAGVRILAVDCLVTENSLKIGSEIPVEL